jgi:hypothetical protein
MSFVKITELPLVNDSFTVLVPGLTAGDLMPIVHGPTTYKVELSTLQEYFQLSVEQVAAGETGEVQVNENDNLSAYPSFVYKKTLSALQVGYDNLHTGNLGGILGGEKNTNSKNNTFILGSNIYANEDNFTLVNNLSAQDDIYAGGTIYAGSSGNSEKWFLGYTYVIDNSARLEQPALDSRYVKLSGSTMTGNLSTTGSLSALGNIYGDKLAVNVGGVPGFNINDAETGTIVGNLSVTGDIYGNIQPVSLGEIANVLYVSTAGNDNNTGRNIFDPLRTIKKACQIVSQNQGIVFPYAPTIGQPTKQWTIFLDTGDYTEQNPIYVPQSTSIIGDNLRRVTVRPANRYYDIFWLNTACYVWGLTFRDHLEPAAGTAFPNLTESVPFDIAFNTAGYEIDEVLTPEGNDYYRTCKPFVTTSPYAQGMSSITQAVISPQQFTYTQEISAETYTGLNGAILNTASARVAREFAIFAGIVAGGSAATPPTLPLNLGNVPTDATTVANILSANRSTIQNAATAYIDTNYPSLFTTNPEYKYAACYRDAGYIIDCVIADLKSGSNARIVEAANVYYVGTLQANGNPPATPLPQPLIYPVIWNYVKLFTIQNYTESYVDASNYIATEFDALTAILNDGPETVAINSLFTPTTDEKRAAELLMSNRNFFQNELTAYVDNTFPNFAYGKLPATPVSVLAAKAKCFRDMGWVIDAVTHDLSAGTNARVITYANSYYLGVSSRIPNQELVTASAINYAKYIASFVIDNENTQSANAGCGIRVDGALARGFLRSFVTDSYTQFNEGGAGIHVTNNGYAQLVSTFTICCTVGISADNGGTCSINTSNSSFGLSGLVGNGYSPTPVLTGQLVDDVLFNSFTMVISGIDPRFDAPNYLQWPVPVSIPYVGLVYTVQGDPSNTLYILTSAYLVPNAPEPYTYAININLPTDNPIPRGGIVNFYIRSAVWTGSHTFEYIGSGVTLRNAVPALGGVANTDDEARGVNGGAVFFTSTNHLGNFKVGNDFTIVQETGTIEGRTFQRSILALVTPLTLALE